MFGVVDVGARYVKNGSLSMKQLSNNGYSANQLGFRGIEDMGDGLQAGFWLEAAHSPDVGTSSATADLSKFWSRRATVSLISARFGELRLGRDLDPSYRNLGAFDVFGNLGVGSNLNLISTLAAAPPRWCVRTMRSRTSCRARSAASTGSSPSPRAKACRA